MKVEDYNELSERHSKTCLELLNIKKQLNDKCFSYATLGNRIEALRQEVSFERAKRCEAVEKLVTVKRLFKKTINAL